MMVKSDKVGELIKNILIGLIILVLIICIFMIAYQKITKPDKSPSIFGIKTFCIISGSMEPNIKINDIVIIKEVPENEIKKGDIISFTINGETITHRIIDIQTNENGELEYITQGDANNIPDKGVITFKNIEGKYIAKIPKIGMILQNKIILVIILIILIVSTYFIKRK